MKQFALIFRQGSRQLTDAELKARADETRAWAQPLNAAGHKLDPHILAPEGYLIASTGESSRLPPPAEGSLTAVVFLEASDLAQAADIARSHPGLRYGASVEVRPWAPPAPLVSPRPR